MARISEGLNNPAFCEQLSRFSNGDISKLVHQTTIEHEKRSQTPLQKYAMKILNIPGFDNVMAVIIVANLLVMIIETDRGASEEVSADAGVHWTEYFSWATLGIFVIELLVKLVALRCEFWKDKSNIVDFLIVAVDAIFSTIGLMAGDLFPVSILRVFRLSKLGRVSKMLRAFPELKMLLAGLMGSIKAIFWGTCMLLLFLLVAAMVAVLIIHPLNKEIDYDGCDRCNRAYSSVAQATLTLFQQIVTGDSWGQLTIPIMEKNPLTMLFFVPVFMAVGLAVMNLFLGVVVNVAQEAYDEQQRLDDADKALRTLQHKGNILELCKEMDRDNNGVLTYDEIFAGFLQPGKFRDSVLSMGIGEEDFGMAWAMLDSHESGSVDYKEFVTFLCTMNNRNSQFMLEFIKYHITGVKKTLLHRLETYHEATSDMGNKLQEQMRQDLIFSKVATGQYAQKGELRAQGIIASDNHQEDKLPLQDSNSQSPLCHADRPCAKSAGGRDWKSFGDDIERLSVELMEILMEMNSNFVPLEATFFTPQRLGVPTAGGQDGIGSDGQLDLLVVPDKPKSVGN